MGEEFEVPTLVCSSVAFQFSFSWHRREKDSETIRVSYNGGKRGLLRRIDCYFRKPSCEGRTNVRRKLVRSASPLTEDKE